MFSRAFLNHSTGNTYINVQPTCICNLFNLALSCISLISSTARPTSRFITKIIMIKVMSYLPLSIFAMQLSPHCFVAFSPTCICNLFNLTLSGISLISSTARPTSRFITKIIMIKVMSYLP